ncbi:MAG: alkaline phosphatase family protein [Candidatus Thorarchaeota archaeon]
MKKGFKLAIIIGIITIFLSGGIVTTLLLVDRENDLPRDAILGIFTIESNIAYVTFDDFKAITNNSMRITIEQLAQVYEFDDMKNITVISTQLNYHCFTSNYFDIIISLKKDGFQLNSNEIIMNSIAGIALDISYSIIDIAPTTYDLLNFSNWSTEGESVNIDLIPSIEKVVIILLDSFGWYFWSNLSSLDIVSLNGTTVFEQPALTAFPSITNVATASLVTGFWPSDTGIHTRQDHQLLSPSMFDIVSNNNLTTEIIEGNVGFINIEADIEHWLIDENDNGYTDEEIYFEANESLTINRSDYLFIHFHGIDDVGHEYGPNTSEWLAKTIEVFSYVNNLLELMGENTLVVITADHGMHINQDSEDYRIGTHGECRYEDIFVPFILLQH